jgi:hypothetical protein
VEPPGLEVDGMPSPNWSSDDELMLDLRAALREPPVDGAVLAAARAAFAWRTVDTDLELIGLLYDSVVDRQEAVREDPAESPRTLAFHGDRLGVEIELNTTGIEGQLIPAQSGLVTLVTVDGPFAAVAADPIGCFSFPTPPGGPIRLECSTDAGRFVTVWITV